MIRCLMQRSIAIAPRSSAAGRRDPVRALIDVIAAATHDSQQRGAHHLDAACFHIQLGQFGCRQLSPSRARRRLLREAGEELANLPEAESDVFGERDVLAAI
jgi:hypothetical protein